MKITEGLLVSLIKSAYAEGTFDNAIGRVSGYDQSMIKIDVDKLIKEAKA